MQTGRISRLSYDELGPGERGVVVLDGVGGPVPHQDVEGLVHAAVEARDALHVEGVRGLVDHRAVLHRLGGNCKYISVTWELCKVEGKRKVRCVAFIIIENNFIHRRRITPSFYQD